MKIGGNSLSTPLEPSVARVAPAPVPPAAGVADVDRADAAASAQLAPAQQALDGMSDIDEARVAEVREALSRGEIQFDPQRLAALIQRYHGGLG